MLEILDNVIKESKRKGIASTVRRHNMRSLVRGMVEHMTYKSKALASNRYRDLIICKQPRMKNITQKYEVALEARKIPF